MRFLCALGGHEASDETTYNSGYYFSACRRCGTDMVRSGATWREIPEGHKVVWKAGRHAHSVEPDYGPVLPTVHESAAAAAPETPRRRRSRKLVPVPSEGLRRTNAAVATPADTQDYPVLLALAALVGAALHFALGLKDLRGGF
ncbi:hypothetical protein E2493_19540 [Sphingomonas parva]|uniref:Uncharacterized protein n=1 Tax=Sphingomonas parva TaxID=2555898 RepID=A0A4Y8ZQ46_9SPHN|nr:hypothetical protein [Sphingomonas parva]TFI56536.1 hypothetical protein E2493_19540 [Sphingomonas parva]